MDKTKERGIIVITYSKLKPFSIPVTDEFSTCSDEEIYKVYLYRFLPFVELELVYDRSSC